MELAETKRFKGKVGDFDVYFVHHQFGNKDYGLHIVVNRLNKDMYFVGKEVAEMLDYANTKKAITDHVREDQMVTIGSVLSGDKTFPLELGKMLNITPNNAKRSVLVTRAGVNRLLMRSKKPEAIEIQDWITDDVMISIQDTGEYKQSKTTEQLLIDALLKQNALEEKARKLAEEKADLAKEKADLAELNMNLVAQTKHLTPFAKAFCTETKDGISVLDFGRLYELINEQIGNTTVIKAGRNQTYTILTALGYANRLVTYHEWSNTASVKYVATEDAINKGYAINYQPNKSGSKRIFLTQKGTNRLIIEIGRYLIEEAYYDKRISEKDKDTLIKKLLKVDIKFFEDIDLKLPVVSKKK